MRNRAPTVVSIGDLVADIVAHIDSLPVNADRHQFAGRVFVEPGGAGNFLIAGARLGMKMVALGVLGRDPFGNACIETLSAEGIGVDNLVRSPGSITTTVIVLIDKLGQHVFIGGYGEGPKIHFSESWQAAIRQAQAAFSYGYTLKEERMSRACLEAIQCARDNRVPVFFDPGPEMETISTEQRECLLSASDYILTTEDEVRFVSGGEPGLEGARRILEQGPKMVCVKRGPQGCVILTHGEQVEHPGFPVQAVDTTASGDSFAAAFIYAILRGWPLRQVAAFANAMGAAKVKKLGSGRQVPTASEVRAILHEFGVAIDF